MLLYQQTAGRFINCGEESCRKALKKQYWYSLPAIVISIFGWFVARIFFLVLTAVGVWLTYVGWVSHRAEAPVDNLSAAPR